MPDVLTPEQRRKCMSRIRGKNTKPEVALRKALWSMGFRYRIHFPLPGKPDIVFSRQRIAIFVDGCFWHRCHEHFTPPESNSEFWAKKIDANVERDCKVNRALEGQGWTVLRYWEHEVRSDIDRVLHDVSCRLAPVTKE